MRKRRPRAEEGGVAVIAIIAIIDIVSIDLIDALLLTTEVTGLATAAVMMLKAVTA